MLLCEESIDFFFYVLTSVVLVFYMLDVGRLFVDIKVADGTNRENRLKLCQKSKCKTSSS